MSRRQVVTEEREQRGAGWLVWSLAAAATLGVAAMWLARRAAQSSVSTSPLRLALSPEFGAEPAFRPNQPADCRPRGVEAGQGAIAQQERPASEPVAATVATDDVAAQAGFHPVVAPASAVAAGPQPASAPLATPDRGGAREHENSRREAETPRPTPVRHGRPRQADAARPRQHREDSQKMTVGSETLGDRDFPLPTDAPHGTPAPVAAREGELQPESIHSGGREGEVVGDLQEVGEVPAIMDQDELTPDFQAQRDVPIMPE